MCIFQSCDQCTSEVDGALRSVIQELEQLTLLLSGSHTDQSLQSQLRGEETEEVSRCLLFGGPFIDARSETKMYV